MSSPMRFRRLARIATYRIMLAWSSRLARSALDPAIRTDAELAAIRWRNQLYQAWQLFAAAPGQGPDLPA